MLCVGGESGKCVGMPLANGGCGPTGFSCSGPGAGVIVGGQAVSEEAAAIVVGSAAVIGGGAVAVANPREREPERSDGPPAPYSPGEVAPPELVQGPPIVSQATGAFDGKLNAHGALIAGIIIILGLVGAVVFLVHKGGPGNKDPLDDFKRPVDIEKPTKSKNKASHKGRKK